MYICFKCICLKTEVLKEKFCYYIIVSKQNLQTEAKENVSLKNELFSSKNNCSNFVFANSVHYSNKNIFFIWLKSV